MRPMLDISGAVLAGWLDPLLANALRATALIAIATLATLALRRAPAATRHLVWTLTLAGLMALPLAASLVPAWSLRGLPAWTTRDQAPRGATGTQVPAPVDSRAQTAVAEPPPVASDPVLSPVGSGPSAIDLVRSAIPVLPILWLGGVLLILVRLGWAGRRTSRLARHARPVTDAGWIEALGRHSETLDLRQPPALKASADVAVPIVCGAFRPTIVLPLAALGWSAERRDAVLLHELAHVRRHDLLTVRAAQLASTLYWFHPLVWHAARAQRAEAERACDDRVLDAGRRASAYASDLLEIAEATRRESFDSAAFAMARRSQLEHRLLAILDPAQARGTAGRVAIAVSLLVATGSIVAIAAARPAKTAPAVPAVQPIAAAPIETGEPARPVELVVHAPVATSKTTNPPAIVVRGAPVIAAPASGAAAPVVAGGVLIDAQPAAEGETSFGTVDDGKGERTRYSWTRPEGRGVLTAKGVIRYNADLSDIVSISPGGSVTIEERRAGHEHKATFWPRGGDIERIYSVDGQARPWDGEARAWFAGFIVYADRGSGMFASQRFPRLMSEGGPTRVLEEISLMTSDYGRAVYFRKLLETRLDDPTMERIIAQAGREIGSDYELARTLITAAEKQALDGARARAALLKALETVESDYEHARVLIILVSRDDLSAGLAQSALESTLRLQSDYERARVLVHMIEHGNVRPAFQPSFFHKVQTMSSDYEQSRVLCTFLARGPLPPGNVAPMLTASATIESDYECANVLVALATSVRLDANGRAAFVNASERIGSDYERSRALAALGKSLGD